MIQNKKFLSFTSRLLCLAIVTFSLSSCEGETSGAVSSEVSSISPDHISSENVSVEESPLLPSGEVASLRYVSFVTGDSAPCQTGKIFGVGGTDLGFPVYYPENDEMLIFFGDTFLHSNMNGNWRSNVMAYSSDFDLSDGLTLDGFLTDNGKTDSGVAVSVIEGKHNNREVTKIPTGAVEVNGALYMFYFSKYSWDIKIDSMNYGGCVKSTDGGESWQRVYDLTWTNHGEGSASALGKKAGVSGNDASNIQALINEDVNGAANKGQIDVKTHEGYFFTQICPVDGKDGYIYIFGEGGYRSHGIKLGRVKKENFEDFNSYEYFCGYEEDGEPRWIRGRDGLDVLASTNESYILGNNSTNCGEHSVAYNPYLKKWVLTYLEDLGRGICYSLADNIYGPYSPGKTLVGYGWGGLPQGVSSIYCSAIHERWIADDGKKMYMLISQYSPIYNTSVIEITFK